MQALPQGHYILIPSTFEPGQRVNFIIRLKTSVPVSEPSLVPAEDSGKFVRTIKGTLPAPTSSRMLQQEQYLDNPRFLLRPRQGCSVSVRLRQSSKGSTPLNASIFSDVSQQASSLHAVGSTGGYASYIAGVTLGPIKLRSTPQGYVLVVSGATVSGAVNTEDIDFDLVILSDHPVDVTRMPG